jgi:hypothetical protein
MLCSYRDEPDKALGGRLTPIDLAVHYSRGGGHFGERETNDYEGHLAQPSPLALRFLVRDLQGTEVANLG